VIQLHLHLIRRLAITQIHHLALHLHLVLHLHPVLLILVIVAPHPALIQTAVLMTATATANVILN
jgi:hypothetical protein